MNSIHNIYITITPIIILIIMLFFNVLYFENSLEGPNQIALLISAAIGGLIAINRSVNFTQLIYGIYDSIKTSLNAMIILLIIGGLTATWILSGVVPAMIYYGVELINPNFFLVSTCIICAIVSLSTGSSWTTSATIGVALIGIGELLTVNIGLVAGAILSGAYFGDKMSPLSETTNLAPSVSGSDLINHIKYMTYTTFPSILITLLIFLLIGLNIQPEPASLDNMNIFLNAIKSNFFIGVELFLLPLIIILLIYNKTSAIKTLLIGLVLGGIFAYIFQPELIGKINVNSNTNSFETIINTIFLGTNIDLNNENMNHLLNKSGVLGMIWIILLVLSAMTFGGIMYAGGFLKEITTLLISKSSSYIQLISYTSGSCLFFNISTCDQYLAIVIPGRMFKEIYEEHQLEPVNLSRTIEDSGTVTSVLVPWNTCSAYHANTLGVEPLSFIPYCFFNIISPFMTLLFAYYNIKIKQLK